MTAPAIPAAGVRRIEVPLVAWLAVAIAVLLLFEMLQENGALLREWWETSHEFFHDGRHFLGVPCHLKGAEMELTYSAVLKRALIVGLIAGVAAAVYLFFVAEPTVDRAIDLEEAATAAEGLHDSEEPLFTRGEQVGGGMLASVIYGGLLAVIFGTVFAAVRHRLPASSDFRRAVLFAAVAFATTALLPALKYPANPPAVGDPDTVDQRTLQYLALVGFGIVVAVLLAKLSGELRRRVAEPTRVVVVVVAAVVAYGAALVAFPASPDAIDPSVPARLIWEFRVQSLGGLALVWAVLGLGLGWSLDRLTGDAGATRPGATPVAV